MKNTFRNPILPGFYPDPSICRVGKDYYLANSSFAYFPGVPLFHSRDLVNWRQIGHALTRKSQLALDHVNSTFGFLDSCKNSLGIWAPTLRHHDGLFYLVTTNMSHGGHFVVTAKDPAAKWSDPVWLDQPGIDPSPFWDEDGRGYLLSNLWPKRPHGIVIAEMDFATGQRRSEIRLLWEGMGAQSPEGPHLYKHGGYYHLLAAEGGTGPGHLVSCARASSLWGPYESCPHNPILSHRSLAHPIQYTGHADMVECHDGSWWMVFLGTRPKGSPACHHLGRETFLAPIEWSEDGWPVVHYQKPVDQVMPAPAFLENQPDAMSNLAGFAGPEWNYLRNPEPACYEIENDKILLRGREIQLDDGVRSPTWIGQRQTSFQSEVSVDLRFQPGDAAARAGLCVYMNEFHFYALTVLPENGSLIVGLVRCIGGISHTVSQTMIAKNAPIRLQVAATAGAYAFSLIDGTLRFLGDLPSRYLSSEVAGGFTGTYFAIFASGDGTTAEFSGWHHQKTQ